MRHRATWPCPYPFRAPGKATIETDEIIIERPNGQVRVTETAGGRRRIVVEPKGGLFTPIREWETAYTLDLIEDVLRVKSISYLCDEIMREEDPRYVEHSFRWDILSYAGPDDFAGKRLLDFGSGSGASTTVLARLLPDIGEIVGVELVPEFVELAGRRARFYGLEERLSFRQSPGPGSLPPGLGQFDFVLFSAVYEHLLPEERPTVLPLIWSHLKPGGVLFLDQTPYRWFPIELHTTGLPLLNYLPDGLTLRYARLSKRMRPDESWPTLLRKGIRGATVGEVMKILNGSGRKAELLLPSRQGVRDHIGLWYQLSSTTRKPRVKKLMMRAFRAIKAITGITMIPQLSLAIRKVQ